MLRTWVSMKFKWASRHLVIFSPELQRIQETAQQNKWVDPATCSQERHMTYAWTFKLVMLAEAFDVVDS